MGYKTKQCTKCGSKKTFDFFHRDPKMIDVKNKRKRPRVIEYDSFEKVDEIQSLPEDSYRTKHPRITYILNTGIELKF